MQHLHRVVFTTAFLALACAFPARADLTFESVGGPTDGGSWYQGLHLVTPAPFQNIGLVLIPLPGDDGTAGLKEPEWDFDTIDGNPYNYAEALDLGDYITVASGDLTNDLYWITHLAGEMADQSFILTVFTFDNRLSFSSIQRAAALWQGTTWDFKTRGGVTWEEFVAAGGTAGVAPLPGSAMLAAVGLAVVGWRERRRNGKNGSNLHA
jgi:hypothetical protein